MVATTDPPVAEPWPSVADALPGEPEAIFVVGASRSGTTLMRNILERSPRIALARENHYVGHLRASEGARFYFRRAGDLTADDTVRAIVAMIYSGEFRRAASNGARRASTPTPRTAGARGSAAPPVDLDLRRWLGAALRLQGLTAACPLPYHSECRNRA